MFIASFYGHLSASQEASLVAFCNTFTSYYFRVVTANEGGAKLLVLRLKRSAISGSKLVLNADTFCVAVFKLSEWPRRLQLHICICNPGKGPLSNIGIFKAEEMIGV